MSARSIDIACMGELLADMVCAKRGVKLEDAREFVMASGGAVANVAIGCAMLGMKSAFIGMVGHDHVGRFLKKNMEEKGVITDGLVLSKAHSTPLVFVSLDEKSRPSFAIHGRPGADLMLEPDDVDVGLIGKARVFHFGTVTLCMEPARSATLRAVQAAREAGATLSYDPNIRLHLWDDRREALEWAAKMIPDADLIKVSDDETDLLLGTREPGKAARELRRLGPELVCVTLGERGAYFSCEAGEGLVEAPKVNAVDTTGAGDAFVAGLLRGLMDAGKKPFGEIKKVKQAVKMACATAAMSVEAVGAVAAFPDYDNLIKTMEERFNT